MEFALNHIINPVNIGVESDLHIAQPITFESLKRAKDFSSSKIEVNLLTTQFKEDKITIPEGFEVLEDLKGSTQTLGLNTSKKLPFIQEIISRAIQRSNAEDYIIYSNLDIAVQPHFYDFIHSQIENGARGIVINRRTISKQYTSSDELDLMYKAIGESHPGFDCFIFPVKDFPNFYLEQTLLGANWIGRILLLNLVAHCQPFILFDDEHLTFHIGDDKAWQDPRFSRLHEWNMKILLDFIHLIKSNETIKSSLLAKTIIDRTLQIDSTTNGLICKKILSRLFKKNKKVKN